VVKGVLTAKHYVVRRLQATKAMIKRKRKKNSPPCEHCGKLGHLLFRCWKRLDSNCNKCNQIGHEAVICKGKSQQNEVNVKVVEQMKKIKCLQHLVI
jgi:hypothetical protein